MLPNHAPLVIAEQFGTLESLYPGRIDLGLGRAPGTDQLHRPRAAPRPRRAPRLSRRTCWSCSAYFGPGRARPARPRRPRRGDRRAALDPRLEHCSAPSSPPRSACPTPSPRTSRPTDLHAALEVYRSDSSRRPSSRAPYAMAGLNVYRRRHRRGGAAAVHHPAAGVGEPLPRRARAVPAADRRHRGLLDAGREGAGVVDADVLPRRLARRPSGDGLDRFVEQTGVDEVMVVVGDLRPRGAASARTRSSPRPLPPGRQRRPRTSLVAQCHKRDVTRRPPGGVERAWKR